MPPKGYKFPPGAFKRRALVDRFNEKIDRSGGPDACWPWNAKTNGGGYGRIQRGGQGEGEVTANVLAWTMVNGPVPEGLVVRHTCDNPPCCNPKHLITGTVKQNSRDMVERGRSVRGKRHHKAKVADHVDEIRQRYASGESSPSIGRRFGVEPASIERIGRRMPNSYQYLGDPPMPGEPEPLPFPHEGMRPSIREMRAANQRARLVASALARSAKDHAYRKKQPHRKPRVP